MEKAIGPENQGIDSGENERVDHGHGEADVRHQLCMGVSLNSKTLRPLFPLKGNPEREQRGEAVRVLTAAMMKGTAKRRIQK
jgi:hypothetical protein